jgi:hypothetical protein
VEALQESIDAIALVLQWHMDHREPLPRPSDKKRGEFWVGATHRLIDQRTLSPRSMICDRL